MIESLDGEIGLQEYLLRDVFDVLLSAAKHRRQREDPLLMPANEFFKGG